MKLAIEGATVITMDQAEPIQDGIVLVEDNRIEYAGGRTEAPSFRPDKRLLAAGKYVLPGFANLHCHLFQVFLRTRGADLNLLDWLSRVIWPVVHRYSAQDMRAAARLGIAENIRSGVTCLVDMNYGNPHFETVLAALAETGIRGFLARGFYEIEANPSLLEDETSILRSTAALMERHANVFPGPMHPCYVTNSLLRKTKELADAYGRPFYTHLAESEGDIRLLQQREGKRDAELLHELGILDGRFIGVHSCNLADHEVEVLGLTQSNTVHCPTSNMYIADGVSPVGRLAGAGANVCLGTDGAASTGRLDMFSEMKTASLLQKIHHMNAAQITARDVLKMATMNGAQALGIRAGVLKRGYLADITILDMQQPNTVYSHDPVAAVVYSAGPQNVDTVIVDGEVLLEGKRFTRLDEERLIAEGQQAASRLAELRG